MAAIKFLNAVTSTGASAIKQLPHLVGKHVVQVLFTGSPTTVTVALQGSLDGTNFFVLDSSTYAASGDMVFIIDKPVTFVQVDLTALSGGTTPTVTVLYEGDKQNSSTIGRRGQF